MRVVKGGHTLLEVVHVGSVIAWCHRTIAPNDNATAHAMVVSHSVDGKMAGMTSQRLQG